MKKNVFVVLLHTDSKSEVMGVYTDKKAAEFIAGNETMYEIVESIII